MVVGVRRHMPRRRSGHTITVTIGAERFCLTANQRDDGSLGEVFIHWGKHGTSAAGLVSTYAMALSLGLQHRVPLADLIHPGLDQFFVPNGHTDDPEIPRVRSAVDYIARRLAIDWLPYPERAALGVYTLTERVLSSQHLDRGPRALAPAGLAGGARQQPGGHHLASRRASLPPRRGSPGAAPRAALHCGLAGTWPRPLFYRPAVPCVQTDGLISWVNNRPMVC